MSKGQAERLVPMLQEVVGAAGLDWRDLTALAVGIGPGNFTGVRIAVATARGLSLALGVPAHGVSALEALAHGLPRPCLAVLDARQGRAYAQGFGGAQHESAAMLDLRDLSAGPALTGWHIVGHESAMLANSLGARSAQPADLAESIARIAAARPAPATRPAPLYLRAADAAPARDAPPVLLP